MIIINIREHPEYKKSGIEYFQSRWGNENSDMLYEDCISRSITAVNPLPVWYLLLDGEKIAGCAGLITNDFISCMDLCPWLCALYIEDEYRGNSYGNLLISQIKDDAVKIGFSKLYICTDHTGYYEKYGFNCITMGYHPWGGSSRVYECVLNSGR